MSLVTTPVSTDYWYLLATIKLLKRVIAVSRYFRIVLGWPLFAEVVTTYPALSRQFSGLDHFPFAVPQCNVRGEFTVAYKWALWQTLSSQLVVCCKNAFCISLPAQF